MPQPYVLDVGPALPRAAFAVKRCAGRHHDHVDDRVEKARGILPPVFLVRVVQHETAQPQCATVLDDLPVAVEDPDLRARILRQPNDERLTQRRIDCGDCLTDQPRLACRLRDAAVDDPAAIGIEVEKAACEQQERKDIDGEDAPRERDLTRPA